MHIEHYNSLGDEKQTAIDKSLFIVWISHIDM